jgi:hypothetical protein
MQRLLSILVLSGRVTAIVFALTALLFSGAGAPLMAAPPSDEQVDGGAESDTPALLPGPPGEDDVTGGVGKGEHQPEGPEATFAAPPVIQPNQGKSRLASALAEPADAAVFGAVGPTDQPSTACLPAVSARLARQFTLVGAKPSGTG